MSDVSVPRTAMSLASPSLARSCCFHSSRKTMFDQAAKAEAISCAFYLIIFPPSMVITTHVSNRYLIERPRKPSFTLLTFSFSRSAWQPDKVSRCPTKRLSQRVFFHFSVTKAVPYRVGSSRAGEWSMLHILNS